MLTYQHLQLNVQNYDLQWIGFVFELGLAQEWCLIAFFLS